MTSIDKTRSNFFPNANTQNNRAKTTDIQRTALKRNDIYRKQELDKSAINDAKVEIPAAIKDFSRIKKAVDAAPEIDNSAKIAKLKQQIKDGNYQFDYEAIADKMLKQEL